MTPFAEKQLLMIPGPTPVPPRVLRAMSQPVISHRGPEYRELMRATTEGLQRVFQTKHDVITYPASGTGAMEAAVVNLFSPGDIILAIVTGPFAQRWAVIAEAFGLNVIRHEIEWGTAATAANCGLQIADCGNVNGILLTHNETVSGVTNDVRGITELIRSQPPSQPANQQPVLCVDAISGLGAIDLRMDEWGVDVVVSGSQKALMLPPGLSFVALNDRAWERHKSAKLPRFYFDWSLHKKSMEQWENPYTPAVNLLFGLKEALAMIDEIGLQNNFARHARLGRAVRAGARALRLQLLVIDEVYASNAVTTVLVPDGLEVGTIISALRERYNIVIAGAAGKLRGKAFRIGHVGYISETEVLTVMSALGAVLKQLGACEDASAGVRAAQQEFA